MSRHARTRLRRITLSGLICASILTTGCSDDDAGSSPPTTTEDSAWCASVRRAQNAVTSQVLPGLIEQAELAPEALAADYDTIIEFVEYQSANPVDTTGIAERSQAAAAPFGRLFVAMSEECGINVNLNG